MKSIAAFVCFGVYCFHIVHPGPSVYLSYLQPLVLLISGNPSGLIMEMNTYFKVNKKT